MLDEEYNDYDRDVRYQNFDRNNRYQNRDMYSKYENYDGYTNYRNGNKRAYFRNECDHAYSKTYDEHEPYSRHRRRVSSINHNFVVALSLILALLACGGIFLYYNFILKSYVVDVVADTIAITRLEQYDDMASATIAAALDKQNGNAGYIYKDENNKYTVLSDFEKNDGVLRPFVLHFSIPNIKLTISDKDQAEQLNNIVNYPLYMLNYTRDTLLKEYSNLNISYGLLSSQITKFKSQLNKNLETLTSLSETSKIKLNFENITQLYKDIIKSFENIKISEYNAIPQILELLIGISIKVSMMYNRL